MELKKDEYKVMIKIIKEENRNNKEIRLTKPKSNEKRTKEFYLRI